MTHEDAGNYAGKRKGITLNDEIAEKIKEKAADKRISCADAHGIAVKFKVNPAEIGAAIDLLEIKIKKCQLGLFGYEGKTSIPDTPVGLNPEIEKEILKVLCSGRIKCLDAWNIAKKFRVSKPQVTGICEVLKIKINECQLGAFK